MKNTLLGRPLTFGDEEQILEIKKIGIKEALLKNPEMAEHVKEVQQAERKKENAESEHEYVCGLAETEIRKMYKKNKFLQQYPVAEVINSFYRYTF